MEVKDIILCRLAHPRSRGDLIALLEDEDLVEKDAAELEIDILIEEGILIESEVEDVLIQVSENPELAMFVRDTNARVEDSLEILKEVTSTEWSLFDPSAQKNKGSKIPLFYANIPVETDSLYFKSTLPASNGFDLQLKVVTSDLLEKSYCECSISRPWAKSTEQGQAIETISFPVVGNEGDSLPAVVISCLKRSRLCLAKLASDVPTKKG